MKTNEQINKKLTTFTAIPSSMILRSPVILDPTSPTLKEILDKSGGTQILDTSDRALAKFNVKHGDHVLTHKGWATVMGVCERGKLWFKVADDVGVSYWHPMTTEIIKRNFLEIEEYYLSSDYGLIKIIWLDTNQPIVMRFIKESLVVVDNLDRDTIRDDSWRINKKHRKIYDEFGARLWMSVIGNDVNEFEKTLTLLATLDAADFNIESLFLEKYASEKLLDRIFYNDQINFYYSLIKILGNKILIPNKVIVKKVQEKDHDFVLCFLENQLLAKADFFIKSAKVEKILTLAKLLPSFIEKLSLEVFINRIYSYMELPAPIDHFFRNLRGEHYFVIAENDSLQLLEKHHYSFIFAYLKQLLNMKVYAEFQSLFYSNLDGYTTELLELFPPIIEAAKSILDAVSLRHLETVAIEITRRCNEGPTPKIHLGNLYLTFVETMFAQSTWDPAITELHLETADKYWKRHKSLATAEVYEKLGHFKQSMLDIKHAEIIIDDLEEKYKDDYYRCCVLKIILPYYKSAAQIGDKYHQGRLEHLEKEFADLEAKFKSLEIEVDHTILIPVTTLLDIDVDSNDNNNNNSVFSTFSSPAIKSPIHTSSNTNSCNQTVILYEDTDEKDNDEDNDEQNCAKRQKSGNSG